MGEVGDLLELMHGARSRFSAVRATVREWHHVERSSRAFQRSVEERGGTLYAGGPPRREPPPETRETIIRFCHEKPARVREEIEGDIGGPRLGVRDGNRWWRYDPSSGAISNEGDPEAGSDVGERLAHLLDPAPLIGALEFEPPARTVYGGRPAFRVRTRPRVRELESPLSDATLFRLGSGADEYDLVVDRERGVLLRTAARLADEEFAVAEVLEIAFDEPLPPETFVFIPPAGEAVRSVSELTRPRAVSLQEAARLAPFTVWVPRRLPPGWDTDVFYVPAEERPRSPASVVILCAHENSPHQVTMNETAATGDDPFGDVPWEPCQHGDDDLRVWAPDQPGQSEAHVQVDRAGTRITLFSRDVDRDTLVELARSLVPAPVAFPAFG